MSAYSHLDYAERLELLLASAAQIPVVMTDTQRWQAVQKLTFEFGMTSSEFTQAGRAAGIFPPLPADHEQVSRFT